MRNLGRKMNFGKKIAKFLDIKRSVEKKIEFVSKMVSLEFKNKF